LTLDRFWTECAAPRDPPIGRDRLAQVAELVDAQVSGTCGATRGGSSPLLGTISSDDIPGAPRADSDTQRFAKRGKWRQDAAMIESAGAQESE
jgi:hypothetical protein